MKLAKWIKSNKLITGGFLLVSTLMSAVAISTIAWYSDIKAFTPYDVSSHIVANYFDSGNGTAASPFVITRPVHYENLVLLHENNEMKVNGVNFADAGLYFQFGKLNADGYNGNADDSIYSFYSYDNNGVLQYADEVDDIEATSPYLNMNYYQGDKALPPLGSSKNPFIGKIIGHDLTISNLHINGANRSDIGIFGYVGNSGRIENAYFEAPVIDVNNPAPAAMSSVNHSSHDTHVYIGYLAGHAYDSRTSFYNVYVNNARLMNSVGNSTQQINATGFFGHSDIPPTVTAESSTKSMAINAPSAYEAINNSYSLGSGTNLVTRNTEYSASGTYDSAMSHSGSSYTSNGKSASEPYSLSTIGFESGDSVSDHIRYKDDSGGVTQLKMITNATELEIEPDSEAWSTTPDGEYLYWSDTQNKWQYTIVESEGSTIDQYLDFNCFTISYVVSDTRYYWYNNNGVLAKSSTDPSTIVDDEERNAYYFVFKPTEGSTGVASFIDGMDPAQYYVYSPATRTYLVGAIETSVTPAAFTENFANATQFSITGPKSPFTYSQGVNNGCILVDGSNLGSRKLVGTVTPTVFDIGNVLERPSDEGAVYERVTDLSTLANNDIVTIIGENSGTAYAMASQNTNNRGSTTGSFDENDRFVPDDPGSVAKLTLSINASNQYRFFDPIEDGFLKNASTSGTNGSNRLITVSDPLGEDTRTFWTISLNASSHRANIDNVGFTTKANLLFNFSNSGSGAYRLFACYANGVATTSEPYLYKRVSTTGSMEHYTNATTIEFIASSQTVESIETFDLFIAPGTSDGAIASNYAATPFAIERTESISVVFDYTNSKVTYTSSPTPSRWEKVVDASELFAGDKVVIVASEYPYALSNVQNGNNREKTTDTITFTDGAILESNLPATAEELILETGTVSNTFAFKTTKTSTNGYLYAASSSHNYLKTKATKDADSSAKITFSSENANVVFQGSNTRNKLQYNSGASIFSCYSSTQNPIQLYKFIAGSGGGGGGGSSTFVGDLVGDRYDPEHLDVVGPATYNATNIYMDGDIDTGSVALTNADIGQKYYTTSYASKMISFTIDVTGSRDLGTITYKYEGSLDLVKFDTGSTGSAISLASLNARDIDANLSDNVHNYLYSFNTTNIKQLSYCGLDSDGNIYVVYNRDGSIKYEATGFDEANIAAYVVHIGTSSAVSILNAQYTFTSAAGNIGNFGAVDYRSATYNASGEFTGASERVVDSILCIYYSVTHEGDIVSIDIAYDSLTKTYAVTISSTTSIVINVFNYDANTYNLTVNGETFYGGTNVIAIDVT